MTHSRGLFGFVKTNAQTEEVSKYRDTLPGDGTIQA